jgi:hypothetical protein
MKWLSFFISVVLFFSCRNKEKTKLPEKINEIGVERVLGYNDTVSMPSVTEPEKDTGYFKGYMPEKIDAIEWKDTTLLFKFLSGIISKKDIILLNNETLSNSVLIDQKSKIRTDTLRNSRVVIVSKYKFSKLVSQKITINGLLVKDYKGTGNDIMGDDFIDFDPISFRHFSFKGEEFYYIRAGSLYSFGTSMGNVNYNLVYNVKHNRLNCFETCRFGYMLFGDANGDDNLDYLDFNNSDFCTTVPGSDNVTIQLYSCNNRGDFILQKDSKGSPYFIEGNTGDDFSQNSFIVRKYYWFRPLK